MGPGVLAELLKELPFREDPRLLVGHEQSDDAGVYILSDETAIVQTIDFFTPIVNDPYDFGRIAAANALSDVYAMGGTPITAMNIVCFPVKHLDLHYLKEILKGGLNKIHEAGAVLVGGHSIEDEEIKYGLSVTGIVHPNKVITNSGARPNDALILTKPIGTGILATGLKGGIITEDDMFEAIEWMAALNKEASEIMQDYSVSACTDITGFGLIGHTLEMARASSVTIEISASLVPFYPKAYELASMGIIPAGTYSNKSFCEKLVAIDPSLDKIMLDILTDPQTSGGLLISVKEPEAELMVEKLKSRGLIYSSIIGKVKKQSEFSIIISP